MKYPTDMNTCFRVDAPFRPALTQLPSDIESIERAIEEETGSGESSVRWPSSRP